MKKELQTILAVGSIAIDTLETPSGNKNNILGGSASYFSLAASLLAPVKLVGVVGTDFPDAGWSLFKSHHINIDNVQILKGKTFRWGGRYNNDYSRRDTLFTELGVFEYLIEFLIASTTIFCPIILSQVCGLYFNAKTVEPFLFIYFLRRPNNPLSKVRAAVVTL